MINKAGERSWWQIQRRPLERKLIMSAMSLILMPMLKTHANIFVTMNYIHVIQSSGVMLTIDLQNPWKKSVDLHLHTFMKDQCETTQSGKETEWGKLNNRNYFKSLCPSSLPSE